MPGCSFSLNRNEIPMAPVGTIIIYIQRILIPRSLIAAVM
jgi:hypothetical protein